MFQDKVLKFVQKGTSKVPAPISAAMKSKTGLAACVVIGGAFTAFGTEQCTGSQAIAGVVIGGCMISAKAVPYEKLLPLALKGIGAIGSLVKRR